MTPKKHIKARRAWKAWAASLGMTNESPRVFDSVDEAVAYVSDSPLTRDSCWVCPVAVLSTSDLESRVAQVAQAIAAWQSGTYGRRLDTIDVRKKMARAILRELGVMARARQVTR